MTKNYKKKIFNIAIIITIANILAKLLGFFRDVLISYNYGSSYKTDAIFLAMSIPLLLLGAFTSSTDSAVIPQYTQLNKEKGRKYADGYFSNIINIMSIIGIILFILILVFTNTVINLFATGFNDIQKEYATKYLKIFSVFGLLHILYCYFCTYNTIYYKVGARAILSFSTNLLVVLGLLIYPDSDMYVLSVAFIIGNIVSALVPIIIAKRNKYKHNWKIKFDGDLKKFFQIFSPIMIAALLINLNLFVDKYLASFFQEGAVSALNYASKLTSIFDNMVVVGLSVAVLPVLSIYHVNGEKDKFKKLSSKIIKYTALILLPIFLIVLFYSYDIIKIVYYRGAFTIQTVNIVSNLLMFYSPLIILAPVQAVILKVFHSVQNTKTPMIIYAITTAINIGLSILLSKIFGLNGIACATSISFFVSVVLLLIIMKKKIGVDNNEFNLKFLLSFMLLFISSMLILFIFNKIDYELEYIYIVFLIVYLAVYFILLFFIYKKEIIQIFRRGGDDKSEKNKNKVL